MAIIESMKALMETPSTMVGLSVGMLVGVALLIWLFLKFCDLAKKSAMSAKVKKWIYILTGLGLIGFNYMFSQAFTKTPTDEIIYFEPKMQLALGVSFVFCLILTWAIVSETKEAE